ncbi:hypothetical protein VF14_23970 [Nostoc linckia z18]|uniref:Pyruvate carboxyltransferase domain-containing protein n=2 Tax=Nostoc linckia TaxID=92942 RepID=A0A9Q5Z991_NOSLI|nr:hypothetical protein [Nostoc linckia]PHK39976.1 hypothetical protein VF12_12240 [Nostoc linckia z15]PHK43996.1 hypothetical protein VF13_24085 [Nostoc linckia z16]PHJ56883.1 hypothetical protein VF02_31875 [Nostoc linckia z1]PHJ58742.1 hypothetical protein VF05_33275 [Nostoc linckia z3]PHJ62550.1 hypothetical protein VF03_31175 [Nostoc linckia z2]
MSTQILDVTLRDGGYVNNHCFTEEETIGIIKGLQRACIKYIEIGYYKPKLFGFQENYSSPAICNLNYLNQISSLATNFKPVVMVHLDHVDMKDYELLANNKVFLVRLITKLENIDKVINHIKAIKSYGMSCSVNLIRISELPLEHIVYCGETAEKNGADWFYIADSNGHLFPQQVSKIIQSLKEKLTVKLGFHAHDGLRLAFVNSVVAVNQGVQMVDASLGGMGKGGGNLVAELIATFLNWQENSIYNIPHLAITTDNYLRKWLKTNSIDNCQNILASILNLNMDQLKKIEEDSKIKRISSIDLMHNLMFENLHLTKTGGGIK